MTLMPLSSSAGRQTPWVGRRPCLAGGAPLPQPVPGAPSPAPAPSPQTPPEVNDPPVPHEHEPVRDPIPMEREARHLH
ncbi:MAG: hypothetical protein ACOZJX_15200 [Pseudomonadota bacterium]